MNFIIKCCHINDNYYLNYYRAYFMTEKESTPLCDCSGGHQTIFDALACKTVKKNSAELAANNL